MHDGDHLSTVEGAERHALLHPGVHDVLVDPGVQAAAKVAPGCGPAWQERVQVEIDQVVNPVEVPRGVKPLQPHTPTPVRPACAAGAFNGGCERPSLLGDVIHRRVTLSRAMNHTLALGPVSIWRHGDGELWLTKMNDHLRIDRARLAA